VKQQHIQQHICLQTEPFLSISSCFSVQTFLLTPELDESKKLNKQKKKKEEEEDYGYVYFFWFHSRQVSTVLFLSISPDFSIGF